MTAQHLIDEALDMREWAFKKMEADKRALVQQYQHHAAAVKSPRPLEEGLDWYYRSKQMLQEAQTFVWSKDTELMAQAAANKLPSDVPFHQAWLPSRAGFWWLGRDSQWTARCETNRRQPGAELPERRRICAISYGVDQDHILMELYTLEHNEPTRGPTVFFGVAWAEGESLTQFLQRVTLEHTEHAQAYRDATTDPTGNFDWWNETSEWAARLLMAACLWMQQKVVVVSPHQGSRPQRKRLEKLQVDATIRVVTLRATEPQPVQFPGTGQPLQWRIHVAAEKGGYWRKQHTKDGIIPIWVQDYWKGPKNAPVKAPAKIIYKVTR